MLEWLSEAVSIVELDSFGVDPRRECAVSGARRELSHVRRLLAAVELCRGMSGPELLEHVQANVLDILSDLESRQSVDGGDSD